MNCDLCGKEARLVHALIEGAGLDVCPECAKFGNVVSRPQIPSKKPAFKERKPTPQQPVKMEILVRDYSARLKKGRESMGLKQAELAKRLNVKESVVQHLESGDMEPDMEMARKLERFFKIVLIETIEDDGSTPLPMAKKSDELTLGDFIKKRK